MTFTEKGKKRTLIRPNFQTVYLIIPLEKSQNISCSVNTKISRWLLTAHIRHLRSSVFFTYCEFHTKYLVEKHLIFPGTVSSFFNKHNFSHSTKTSQGQVDSWSCWKNKAAFFPFSCVALPLGLLHAFPRSPKKLRALHLCCLSHRLRVTYLFIFLFQT